MIPRTSLPAWTVASLTLVLCSCATGTQDPFGVRATRADRDRAESYRVRFEVSCDTCAINWRVGIHSGNAGDNAVWSHGVDVTVYPRSPTMAYLSAAPVTGSISWVRISVNGRVVAEAPGDAAADLQDIAPMQSLSVSTPIPPPEGKRVVSRGDLSPRAPPPPPPPGPGA